MESSRFFVRRAGPAANTCRRDVRELYEPQAENKCKMRSNGLCLLKQSVEILACKGRYFLFRPRQTATGIRFFCARFIRIADYVEDYPVSV